MARAYPICSSKAEPLRIARRSVMRGTIYPRIRGPGRCSPTAPPGWSSRDLGGRSPPRVAGSRLARLVALLGPVDPVGGLAVVLGVLGVDLGLASVVEGRPVLDRAAQALHGHRLEALRLQRVAAVLLLHHLLGAAALQRPPGPADAGLAGDDAAPRPGDRGEDLLVVLGLDPVVGQAHADDGAADLGEGFAYVHAAAAGPAVALLLERHLDGPEVLDGGLPRLVETADEAGDVFLGRGRGAALGRAAGDLGQLGRLVEVVVSQFRGALDRRGPRRAGEDDHAGGRCRR